MSINELALIVKASVTLEAISLSSNCTMTGSAVSISVYTKIVSVISVTYERLWETIRVTASPAVIAVEYVSAVINDVLL